jgi:hypothetical protein
MKYIILILFCLFPLTYVSANSSGNNLTKVIRSFKAKNGLIFENQSTLAEVKKSIAKGSKKYSAALNQLIFEADTSLRIAPVSVMEKTQLPVSGDKHDYISLARYYWPDTTKPNGLPYAERDGVVNPEIYSITDYNNFGIMNTSVHTLALAYYFTGEGKYAEHAAEMIRVWFLNPATRMNPNLNFAQAIKGVNNGRPTGLIETREIGLVGDAAGLIKGSKEWTEIDQKGLKNWFSEYLDWLLTSPNGTGEAKSINNHGVWFDVQITSVALFAGREDVARKILEESKSKRIEKEIEPDGSMPLELARTISKHYIRFTLEGFFRLASIGERVGIDLWNYSKDGRSLQKAIEYPIPYILGKKEWKFKQIYSYNWNLYYPLYLQASVVYKKKHNEYNRFLKNVSDDRSEKNRLHLILGK